MNKRILLTLLCLIAITGLSSALAIEWTSPGNGDINVPIDVSLSGNCSDNSDTTVNLTFYNNSGSLLCVNSTLEGVIVGCDNMSLNFEETYCYSMNCSNSTGWGNITETGQVCFTTIRSGLRISLNQETSGFTGLKDLVLDVVDIGLNTLVHFLERMPGITILVMVVGIILAVLVLVKLIFGNISGFFGNLLNGIFKKGAKKGQ